jgi:hypothetical protein
MKAAKYVMAVACILCAQMASGVEKGAQPPPQQPPSVRTQPSAPPAPASGFLVNARVFLAGETQQQGPAGTSQLRQTERNLTTRLGYHDYKLVTSGQKGVQASESYRMDISEGYAVVVTPLEESGERVKVRIAWVTPDGKEWEKTLYFARNVQSIIGGPHLPDGGLYLLSISIR